MPTAVSYARYSSELQKDSSIEDQQRLCRRFAEREGYDITAEYSDRALSGSTLFGREGIHELLAAAKAGAFKTVIVESLDRISRDQEDTAYVYKRLSFAGVTIQTIHDGPVDAIQVGIRGLVGSMYRKDLGLKVHRGLAGRVIAGKNPGGRWYGYKSVSGEAGEIKIDAAEAAVVARIFAEYADGKSTVKIARGLNDDGLSGPRGGLWWPKTMLASDDAWGGILRCDLYRGVRVWNRTSGVQNPDNRGKIEYRPNPESEWQTVEVPHLRIVGDEVWERVSHRISNRAKVIGRPLETGKPRLLTGLLFCGVCGGRMMRASVNHQGPLITCRQKHHTGQCTHNRYYKLEKIEAVVAEMVTTLLVDPIAAANYVQSYMENRRKENSQLGKLRKQAQSNLNRAKAAKERVISMGMRGIIDLDATEKQARVLTTEIAELEATLARAPDPSNVDYRPEAVRAYRHAISTVAEKGNNPEMEEYRANLRKLIEKVIIHPSIPYKPYKVEVRGLLVSICGKAPERLAATS